MTKNTVVQITDPSPQSEKKDNRITLYKWWPSGRQTFNINTPAQWTQIKEIVDNQLGPILGWKSRKAVTAELAEIKAHEDGSAEAIGGLLAQHPGLIAGIVGAIDPTDIDEADLPALATALGDIAAVFVAVDEKLRTSIAGLVAKLPKETAKAIGQLTELMESLTIGQIAAVAAEVARRVGLLRTFSDRARDEKTYEIKGDGSIHRLLEQAMWIIDERYWLMHTNRTLRTVVGKELAKRHKEVKDKRPDFVCGTVDSKLIIIELKKPSLTLSVADLNQLEQYVVICREYDDTIRSFEAILVGKKTSRDLDQVLRVRSSSFRVRTYAQLVADAERRYDAYLEHLDAAGADL